MDTLLESALGDAYAYRLGDGSGPDDEDLEPFDAAMVRAYRAAQGERRANDLARIVARYDEAAAEWREANASEDEAPSVREAEVWSERLEAVAHDLVDVLRPLLVDAPDV